MRGPCQAFEAGPTARAALPISFPIRHPTHLYRPPDRHGPLGRGRHGRRAPVVPPLPIAAPPLPIASPVVCHRRWRLLRGVIPSGGGCPPRGAPWPARARLRVVRAGGHVDSARVEAAAAAAPLANQPKGAHPSFTTRHLRVDLRAPRPASSQLHRSAPFVVRQRAARAAAQSRPRAPWQPDCRMRQGWRGAAWWGSCGLGLERLAKMPCGFLTRRKPPTTLQRLRSPPNAYKHAAGAATRLSQSGRRTAQKALRLLLAAPRWRRCWPR